MACVLSQTTHGVHQLCVGNKLTSAGEKDSAHHNNTRGQRYVLMRLSRGEVTPIFTDRCSSGPVVPSVRYVCVCVCVCVYNGV